MAHIFADNVREGSVTEGTGDFVTSGGITSPGGVIVGRRLADVLTESDTFDYTIFHTTLNEWEIGVGTYIGPNTFSRSPSSSSNGGNLVSFSPGAKQVFIAPVAARMSDVVSDDNLPHVQSGKVFTSTVSVTGESGLRIDYGDQQISIGGTSADPSDFPTSIRNINDWSTWYVDTDVLTEGFRLRYHEGGSNFSDIFSITPDGNGKIAGRWVKTVTTSNERDEQSFPIGHTLLVDTGGFGSSLQRQISAGVSIHGTSISQYVLTDGANPGSLPLSGVWRSRGRTPGSSPNAYLMERTA